MDELDALFDGQGGVATTGQLRRLLTRRGLESKANHGDIVKLWFRWPMRLPSRRWRARPG